MASTPDYTHMTWNQYRQALEGRRLPLALVNLDALDVNVRIIRERVQGTGKTLRIASKSLRVPGLLRTIVESNRDICKGVMAYTVEEGVFLAREFGFDDVLVAYPTVQASDLRHVAQDQRDKGEQCPRYTLMVDSLQHLDALNQAGRHEETVFRLCIDLDMSYRPFGDAVHIGVRRSPVRKVADVLSLVRYAQQLPYIRIIGVMGYEAQIAGLGDSNPFSRLMNPVRRKVRELSAPDVAARREEVAEAIRREGVELEFFNGGGTGSLNLTPKETAVTEVTAGSGFFCSHLFSYYSDLPLVPAALFALQVVRKSDPGYLTCHGGGYVATGEIGPDRLPVPFLPEGLELLKIEGVGEVQTPLYSKTGTSHIKLGDPILFRHAKAGELAEHFNSFSLLRQGEIIGEEKTYRGYGNAFL